MKLRIISTSAFAILLFAGIASAQHVKAFSGRDGALLSSFFAFSKLPTINALASEPIRIEISARRGDEQTMYVLIGSQAQVRGVIIPCPSTTTSVQRRSGGNAGRDVLVGGAGQDYLRGGDGSDYLMGGEAQDLPIAGTTRTHGYLEIKLKPVYITSYQTSAAGKCGVLSVKLANGTEHRGFIRFR